MTEKNEAQVSIGRCVHYSLTSEEADKMNQRREDTRVNGDRMRRERPGFQAHVGNRLYAGDIVAMTVTKVLTDSGVNGQAVLDGNDSLWVLAANEGGGHGCWSWPVIEVA